MKPIILILSCKRDVENGSNDVCRQTWIKEWGHLVDYKFCLGQELKQSQDDELVLPAPDSKVCCPTKLQKALEWAIKNGYTHFFKCDTDTYAHIPRLLESGFEQNDYVGNFGATGSFAHGGPGYWLSLNAARLVVSARESFGAEDALVGGWVLLDRTKDNRYTLHESDFWRLPGITFHVSRTKEGYGPPTKMFAIHEKIVGGVLE